MTKLQIEQDLLKFLRKYNVPHNDPCRNGVNTLDECETILQCLCLDQTLDCNLLTK